MRATSPFFSRARRRAGRFAFSAASAVLASGALLLAGCEHKIEGPELTIKQDQTYALCGDQLEPYSLEGTGISPMVVEGATDDPNVDLPDICLLGPVTDGSDPAALCDTGATETCIPEENVTWVNQKEIQFTVPKSLGLAPGDYAIVVRNPNGDEVCGAATLTKVANSPDLFWADPAVVYNGIKTQITVYGSNLGDENLTSVYLLDDADNRTDLTPIPTTNTNRFQVVIPGGLPAGTYTIVAEAGEGCSASLVDGLEITDTTDPDLVSAVDPTFGGMGQTTPVTVTGMGLQSVPRVYLNPVSPTADTVASALSSVAFIGATRLTSIVPQGLPPGDYDLIVVNPDGTVGILDGAFTVTADAPPVVDSVSPGTVTNQMDQDVLVRGTNFRSPAVDLTCKLPDDTIMDLAATVNAATTECTAGNCIAATLPVTGLAAGTVCVMHVTNGDGSFFDYSAVGIVGSAGNLSPFELGPDMGTPRRGLVATSGRATRAARFLYAIGGDDGDEANAYTSVESAPIDVFGDVGDWFDQPESLPVPRTLAGLAQIGRYLYLVGGYDGSAATGAVSRAMILDPAQAPTIDDVSAVRHPADDTTTPGVGSGVWYYRVSAVMDATDESNPGGETLASDPIAVNLPDSLEGTIDITLMWSEVPGAAGYRIYRSPTGTEAFGNEELVGEVDGGTTTTFEDAGKTTGVGTPLPLGSTGVWKDLPALGTPRVLAGVAAAQDPSNPDAWYVYAVGGMDEMGAALDTWERLDVTIDSMGVQSAPGPWQLGTSTLMNARSALGLYALTPVDSAEIETAYGPTATVLYAGAGTESSDMDGAVVEAGGDLTWSYGLFNFNNRSGYGKAASAGYIFAFGGNNDTPSASSLSGLLQAGTPPEVANFNNLGNVLLWARRLMGTAHESSFVYLIGGNGHDQAVGGPDAATATIERTVL